MKYKYSVVDAQGNKSEGSMEAESREQVARDLQNKGLIILSVEESVGFAFSQIKNIQIGGFKLKDRLFFTKQLVAMLTAGLPLTQSIDVLVEQAPNSSMREELTKVYKDLESGSALSQAFAKNSKIFNDIQINLIAAGEKSGNLVEIMTKIGKDMEKDNNLKRKIRGALIYPAVIFVAISIVMAVLIIFMVPQMEKLYEDFGLKELPFVTRILVNISHFLVSIYGVGFIIIVLSAGIGMYAYYKSTIAGKRMIDKVMLKLPVFGSLNNKIQVAEFSRLLALLLSSGVPIIDALNIVSTSLSNSIYAEVVSNAAKAVTKGVPLAVPLAEKDVLPKVLIRVIAVGEETGNLDKVLADMAAFYDAEVDAMADNLTKLLEPFILMVVGGLVAFLAMATYWPIYGIGQVG